MIPYNARDIDTIVYECDAISRLHWSSVEVHWAGEHFDGVLTGEQLAARRSIVGIAEQLVDKALLKHIEILKRVLNGENWDEIVK